ncbi:MAG: DegV family EDD domain-containing protein [Clostridiales bacterium]|nr:DegV family EDD domain-containing protein [Clostridiales bacterium]
MLTLFCDSDMDMTPESCKEYGYKMICMPYAADGKTVNPYEDYEVFDAKAYYDTLRAGTIPTTSAISEMKYKEYFEPEFAAGNDILYVHFSAAMTMTFDNMHRAVDELKAAYPERNFYEIDTKGITILSNLIAKEIGRLFKEGKSLEYVLEWAKTEIDHYAVYFFADDLKFFKRSGRVGGLSAAMGTIIGIRPIINIGENGKMESVGKEVGRAKALKHLIDVVKEIGDCPQDYKIIIGHTDAIELAETLANMLKAELGDNIDYDIVVTNPTTGAHCGPDSAGIAFHSKHR